MLSAILPGVPPVIVPDADSALAAQSASQAAASAVAAAGSADAAEGYAADAAAERAIIGTAADIADARDATLLYKTGAEDAQASAQDAASDTAADRVATAADRAAAALSAAQAASTAANLVPYSPIAQTQLYDVGGSVVLTGTGTSLVDSDHNIAISPKGAVGEEALYGATTNTSKAVAIGPWALGNFNGYDSVGIGWRAARYVDGDNTVSIGIHSGEATNYSGRSIHGYGVRASGTITFTGLPSSGDTITLGGVTFTAGTDFTIAGTVSATIDNLLDTLLASASTALKGYLLRRVGSTLEIRAAGAGTWGNAFTLAVSGAGLAVSGATLSGGTLQTSDGNRANFNGMVAIGTAAVKRFDNAYGREARNTIYFGGVPAVGATLTLGIPATVSTASTTSKLFTWVASGATSQQINQGVTKAQSIRFALDALQAYQAANPSHTQMSAVDFYATADGIEVVYKTQTAVGNSYKTLVSGANLSTNQRYLHGGVTFNNNAPIGIGLNIEAGLGANIVAIGKSAFRVGQGSDSFLMGGGSGGNSIGNFNCYWFGSGQSIIGSNNYLLGQVLGSASTQAYAAVASVSSTGLVTMASPHSDPELQIGRRFVLKQRNTTLASDLIKQAGSNMATVIATVVSPTQFQIIDFSDYTGPAGADVFTVSGTPGNIELAPFYATLEFATSWGDAPESYRWDIGTAKHDKASVRPPRLELGTTTLEMSALVSGATAASGNILFTANFADGDTVTLNGTAFRAKATPVAIRDFTIGANLRESLYNLVATIRNTDDQSASAKAVNRASFWVYIATNWRLGVRVDADTGATAYTLATSVGTATVTAPTGASSGTLPTASSPVPPADGAMRVISSWPRANGGRALMAYQSSDDAWHFRGGAA